MTETVHKQNSWENVQDFFHSVTFISRAGVVQMFWEAIHGGCPAKIWNLQTGGLPNKGRQGTESPIPFDPKGASCQVLQKATNDLLKALRWFMMYVEKFYANQKFVSTYIWMSMCMYIQAIWISIHYKQEEHFWCKGLYFKVHCRDLLSFTQVSSKFSSHGHGRAVKLSDVQGKHIYGGWFMAFDHSHTILPQACASHLKTFGKKEWDDMFMVYLSTMCNYYA